ncbi:MAG TPA: murein biosynthesis integral membrane protein MurJ [Myxococcota bacterium]|nr:murein biosynthesis integral membrane protein MurJ [Myxococcota bacterium]
MSEVGLPIEAGAAPVEAAPVRSGRFAALVAAGILLSRVAGLVRERAFAHYFGSSAVADALKAAFRIPNLLQNLFGEGVLSASFIPVYARLLAKGQEAQARRLAGAVAAALALAMAVLVLAGVLCAPWLVELVAPGFEGERRALTVTLVRILFPGVALLVLSAWCLGILNSHHRFFLSYAAPVLWNVVIIVVLVASGGRHSAESLAIVVAWAAVAGSATQFAVQLPRALSLGRPLGFGIGGGGSAMRTVLRNFGPAFLGRGVVQVSAYVDQLLASLLPLGAVAFLGYAQTLSLLPVSLFGMSISAAELPAMSRAAGAAHDVAEALHRRLLTAVRRVAFFVVPSAVAFLALGDSIAAAVYQTGRFTADDADVVWAILAGSAPGLVASTLARLYSSTFYALHDTRTPMRFAWIRLGASVVLGVLCAFGLPRLLGIEPRFAVAGLALGSGLAGFLELGLLRRALDRRIGVARVGAAETARLAAAAGIALAGALVLRTVLPPLRPIWTAFLQLGAFGGLYLGTTLLLGVREATVVWRELRARVPRRRRAS